MSAARPGRGGTLVPEHGASLAADHARLLRDVERAETAGRTVPCRSGRWLDWTSDDPSTQRAAARACEGCPVFEQCERYGRRHPAERGAYGGQAEHDRRREVAA